MAAPTTSTRGTPAGYFLPDGYSSKIALTRLLTVSFWEKTVKPPGWDGGDAIDITTMHNTAYVTMAARALATLTENTTTAAYDPNVMSQIVSTLLNQEGSCTHSWGDGSTIAYYGYLRVFEPNDCTNGEQPEATVTITPTNYDPVARVEAAPVITSVSGT